jgi:MYXO-CTERM domain-containing protein
MIALGVAALLGSATPAHAFCGFYVGGAGAKMFNNATEVVLMRHGTTTVLSMQNNYQGPPDKFALVVPVPVVVREKQVKTLPPEVFAKVDVLGAPRLVEYWEADPCRADYDDGDVQKFAMMDSDEADEEGSSKDEKEYKVKIEAKFSVAEYDIVVLSAQESTGLERWLRANKYEIPAAAEALLRPYVETGMKFFIAKVDPKKVRFQNGMATLSPLRFYYDSPEFTLPIRLGLANSSGTQDLIVNILAPNQRYEAANHPNVTIPTNLPVKDEVRTRFGEFYAALFDHTLLQVPNAVVTEYSWDSGSCDPCPGPVLEANDLATLGADVIGSTYKDASTFYTLTRLHARYGTDVKDDLVFRAVEPIMGGRGTPDTNGVLPNTVEQRAGANNFQGRYVIMHPWTGTVACASPIRGRWGAPPDGQQIAVPATSTAFQPRGKLELADMVAATPQIGQLASSGSTLPIPVRAPRANGCGCETGGGPVSALGAIGVGLVLLRRRRRT